MSHRDIVICSLLKPQLVVACSGYTYSLWDKSTWISCQSGWWWSLNDFFSACLSSHFTSLLWFTAACRSSYSYCVLKHPFISPRHVSTLLQACVNNSAMYPQRLALLDAHVSKRTRIALWRKHRRLVQFGSEDQLAPPYALPNERCSLHPVHVNKSNHLLG